MEMESGGNEERDEFTARSYQIELLEIAKIHNTILYLPTGSGKTFIATMLIKHMSKDLYRPYVSGGMRTFFIVNTVTLVSQQAESIRRHSELNIGEYSGDMNLDYWDLAKWRTELIKNQVFVMTSQIFLNMLLHGYVQISQVNLVIFDECHHAVAGAPMRQIMQHFDYIDKAIQPRIMGLTATLLNSNCKNPNKLFDEIRSLEVTFNANIATAINNEMVKVYSTNPVEEVVYYQDGIAKTPLYVKIAEEIESLKTFCHSCVQNPVLPIVKCIDNSLVSITEQKKLSKELRNVLEDVKLQMDSLGMYGVFKAALARIILVERLKRHCEDTVYLNILDSMLTSFYYIRKLVSLEFIGHNETDILKLSSHKVNMMINVLKDFREEDTAIVFVERRFTAKVLYYILKDLSKTDSYKHIKPNFIVGLNVNPFNDTREGTYLTQLNRTVMTQFNKREVNILIASDVIEEGIDIQLCNYVIKFDCLKTFRSYIQSKGRARHMESRYLIFVPGNTADCTKQLATYNSYKIIENSMNKLLAGEKMLTYDDDVDASSDAKEAELQPYFVNGPGSPCVTQMSAIALVNRYCSSLPQDRFGKLAPLWWLDKSSGKKAIILQLPINCPIKTLIRSGSFLKRKNAMRAVALKACEMLHKCGELDDHLLPKGPESDLLTNELVFPQWQPEDEEVDRHHKPGTRKMKRLYLKAAALSYVDHVLQFPLALSECRPTEHVSVYVHVIEIYPIFPQPDKDRLLVFYNLLASRNNYAILSTKQIPKICRFPLFINDGELQININISGTVHLSAEEILQLEDFHSVIFSDLMHITKTFMIKDYANLEDSYLLAPVRPDGEMVTIDWETVRVHRSLPLIKQPTPEERISMVFDTHFGKVVAPWYRGMCNQQNYIVTKVYTEMTPASSFPSEDFQSYEHYFKKKYNLSALCQKQPLIEVRAISSRTNLLLPRNVTGYSSKRKRKEDEDFEETLVPEYCFRFEFPAVYWLKASVLPSVLHRLHHILLAEQLRQRIARETGLGLETLPPGVEWEPVTVDKACLPAPVSMNCVDGSNIISTLKAIRIDEQTKNIWGSQMPVDIDRQLEDLNLVDIIYYDEFISMSPKSKPEGQTGQPSSLYETEMVAAPELNILRQWPATHIGPQLGEMLQALTAATANDIVNFERLETLGDSFLKYTISLVLFTHFTDIDEGKLTQLRSKFVGNHNLYYCGKYIELGRTIKVCDFAPQNDWTPPGFCVPRRMQEVIRIAEISPSILFHIRVPQEEVNTGKLSAATEELFRVTLLSAPEDEESKSGSNVGLVSQHSVSDKTIADAVEALIGLYLKDMGVRGALALLPWLGVLAAELVEDSVLTKPSPSARLNPLGDVGTHLRGTERLEERIGYTFKDRTYLLQALTHPTYNSNSITDCYQRLEFLGDAIIDFLITGHIYEYCGNLSPGDLTDLRSALVNNATLASIAVRIGLHKFYLALSCSLSDIVDRFVKHQEQKNFQIGEEVLFLVEESDCLLADGIDVPKVLGDLLESLIGAIFLDCGKDLAKVWHILYNCMRPEIEQFSKNVPKNHCRLLFEVCAKTSQSTAPKFGKSDLVEGSNRVHVPLEINYKGENFRVHGFGENKSQAKMAAAKMALRQIRILS